MVYRTCLYNWSLLFLPLLLLAACTATPETQVTIPVARSTTTTPTIEAVANQTSSSPSPVPPPTTAITGTATATPTTTPTASLLTNSYLQATATARRATTEAEVATLFAPTPTFTPSPTFTPVPGPVWRIFFRGSPCQDDFRCEDTLFMNQRPMGYLINSDGSQLMPITDLGFPADFSHPVFSPDGTQLAYLANVEADGFWHLFLANTDGSEAVDLGTGDFSDYQFLPEPDCLIAVQFVSWAAEGVNLMVEKRCINQSQPHWLETITLPVFQEIHFLPQTDIFLVYGEDIVTEEIKLFVHTLNGETNLLFTQAEEYFIGTARWLPDGEQIEFTNGLFVPEHPITTTFNLIQQDGTGLEVRLNVPADFAITSGTWSPDGQEFAFTYGGVPGEESGIYILNLNSGEWRQILSNFYLTSSPEVYIWQQATDGVSE